MRFRPFFKNLNQYSSLIGLIILIVVVSNIVFPGATSLENIASMSMFGVEVGLIALGSALIILGGNGGIDLSVGAIYALTQIIVAQLMVHGVNMWLSVLVGLIAGLLLGGINGYIVTKVGIPAIITTLATMYAYNGIGLIFSNGVNISNLPKEYAIFGQGILWGVPFQLIAVYLPALLIFWYLISRSVYGYQLYLTGTNDSSARLSGINTDRIRLAAYMITGLLSGMAGIIGSSRLLTARPDGGDILNLQAITIAVLGGTSIFGGRGTVIGTFLATIVITMISYIYNLVNINSVIQTGTIGLILILVTLSQNRISEWAKLLKKIPSRT
ncbi:ABC transporter permease [Neobacillus pocheonensis]|uniref:ABC transporter permease n=1 Tax=Neobacillus pocheonensis TaxID=363869 RepID=UPI003D28B79B